MLRAPYFLCGLAVPPFRIFKQFLRVILLIFCFPIKLNYWSQLSLGRMIFIKAIAKFVYLTRFLQQHEAPGHLVYYPYIRTVST